MTNQSYKKICFTVTRHSVCTIIIILFGLQSASAKESDTTVLSSRLEAISFIEKITHLEKSPYWPKIDPKAFLHNLKENIYNPLELYEGTNTNFCGYAALTYLPLHDDPLGYAQFLLKLYHDGRARYGRANFHPSEAVRKMAGDLKYKGMLDVKPADQLWLLSLADRFKGYINILNQHYQPGDENTFWASVNYGKFNRMIKKLFNYHVTARGTDLLHPRIENLYEYISAKLKTGTTFLYLNNTYLRKKNHNSLRSGIPTHFITVLNITQSEDGLISLTYWDYGFKTLRQVSPAFLKKIVFGISHCTKIKAHEN